ncbi:MAG: outer membrane lipoprotein-sorting protein [Dissulfuribacterales bacterium]
MKKFLLLCFVVIMLTATSLLASELKKPHDGISADDLMRISYVIQYTMFLHDIQLPGDIWYVSKGGFKRHKRFIRSRIILERAEDDLKYKDLVVITEPKSVKGLAVLSWTHLDPKREQDQWLWLPSLKKVRKVSQSAGDDAFFGSDFTTEEITTRRWEDETYRMLGEEKFTGYDCEYDGNTYYKGVDCFKVESKPKRTKWYYSKRISWLVRATGEEIYQEIYDPAGQKTRTIFKRYKTFPKGYLIQTLLECKNLRNGHRTIITFDDIKTDHGLTEDAFTEKTLMRSRW